MPILIDGNNLLHRLPRGVEGRDGVRRLVLEQTRRESMRVVLVFDGPPPDGTPEREELGRVRVVYAGARSADDVIVTTVSRQGRAAEWVVVTDDRDLRSRVRQLGAQVRSLSQWRGHKQVPVQRRQRAEAKLSAHEVAEWEAFFKGGG